MVLFGGVWVCFLIQGSQSLYFLSKKKKIYFYPIIYINSISILFSLFSIQRQEAKSFRAPRQNGRTKANWKESLHSASHMHHNFSSLWHSPTPHNHRSPNISHYAPVQGRVVPTGKCSPLPWPQRREKVCSLLRS